MLASANTGFDHIFANNIADARTAFSDPSNADSPFHLLGLSVCAFLLIIIYGEYRESYMGYYALNAAHSKFKKLYKTVFPAGLDGYRTPAPGRKVSRDNLAVSVSNITSAALDSLSVAASRNPSSFSVSTIADSSSASSVASTPTPAPAQGRGGWGIFGRWGASTASLLSTRFAPSAKSKPTNTSTQDLR
ncbi:hypothetical protein K438DRAFT_1961510 [Mycena galopus ATCC 62051]|nr:hypothetical protein K438DRAFT_1961510 [Mycena galopus ATCC 62051]